MCEKFHWSSYCDTWPWALIRHLHLIPGTSMATGFKPKSQRFQAKINFKQPQKNYHLNGLETRRSQPSLIQQLQTPAHAKVRLGILFGSTLGLKTAILGPLPQTRPFSWCLYSSYRRTTVSSPPTQPRWCTPFGPHGCSALLWKHGPPKLFLAWFLLAASASWSPPASSAGNLAWFFWNLQPWEQWISSHPSWLQLSHHFGQAHWKSCSRWARAEPLHLPGASQERSKMYIPKVACILQVDSQGSNHLRPYMLQERLGKSGWPFWARGSQMLLIVNDMVHE